MTTATTGRIANVHSVSRQLKYNSRPKLARIVIVLRIATVIVFEAAEASWCASKVSFDCTTPPGVMS